MDYRELAEFKGWSFTELERLINDEDALISEAAIYQRDWLMSLKKNTRKLNSIDLINTMYEISKIEV